MSHIVADAVPHKDLPVRVEVPLLAATFTFIAGRYGLSSPQFWGAVGAVCPDAEHGLLELGLIRAENEVFPTHMDMGRWHGRKSNERISQVITVIIAAIVAERVR
jgi:hypothetical protein